jgi:NhaP-type Na+/H+ or K+/H+ antiporter
LKQHGQQQPESGADDGVTLGRIGDRPFWVLHLSILIRSVHQVAAAVFLAAYLLDAIPGPPLLYVVIALLSGGLLMLSEWLRHRQIFRELSGVITLAKILLLGAAFHGFLPPWETVLLAFVIASIGAHAPKKIRHRLLY